MFNHFKSFRLQFVFAALLSLLISAGCVQFSGLLKSKPSEPTYEPADEAALVYFTRGSYLLEMGDYDGAEKMLTQASRLDPGAAGVHAKLAELYFIQNRLDEARKEALAVLEVDDDNIRMLILMGQIEAGRSDFKSARRYLLRAKKQRPQDDDIDLTLWRVNASLGRYDDAIEALDSLIRRYPDVAELYFFSAMVYEAAGDADNTTMALRKTLEINPNMAPAIIKMGDAMSDSGDIEGARKYYRRALDIDPGSVEARQRLTAMDENGDVPGERPALGSPEELGMALGLQHLKEGRYDAAIAEFERLHKDRPQNTLIAFYLGVGYEAAGKLDEAMVQYQSIPPESSIFTDAALRRAAVLLHQDRLDEATSLAETIAGANPDRRDIQLLLARLYLKNGKPERAVVVLEGLNDRERGDTMIMFFLGAAYGEAGREEDAIEMMRRILQLNPDSPEALNYIGYSLADKGVQLNEAESLILKALELKPDNPSIIDSLGWLYFRQGKIERAIEQLERAYDLAPEEPEIMEHLADVYRKAGKTEEALSLYRKALIYNESPERENRLKQKIAEIEQKS